MAERSWRNAEGQPILCAVRLKTSQIQSPKLSHAQLRETWPDLASTAAGNSRLLVVMAGSSGQQGHQLEVHVKTRTYGMETRKSFYLSRTGRLFKALGAKPGDVLALVGQPNEKVTADLNTPEAQVLVDIDFSGGSHSSAKHDRRAAPAAALVAGAGAGAATAATAASPAARGWGTSRQAARAVVAAGDEGQEAGAERAAVAAQVPQQGIVRGGALAAAAALASRQRGTKRGRELLGESPHPPAQPWCEKKQPQQRPQWRQCRGRQQQVEKQSQQQVEQAQDIEQQACTEKAPPAPLPPGPAAVSSGPPQQVQGQEPQQEPQEQEQQAVQQQEQEQEQQAPQWEQAAQGEAGVLYDGTTTSDDEWAELQRESAALAQRRPRITGNHDAPLTQARAQQEATEEAAALAALGGKRARRASWKARERDTEGQQPCRRRGRPRTTGLGGMGGFGGHGGSSPTYQPIHLLPGEEALGVELFFGEVRLMLDNGKAGPMLAHAAAGAGRGLQGSERYRAAVDRARQLLGQRMRGQGADEVEVATMLRLLRDFEGKCLAGEPSTAEECQQLCCELDRRLRRVYNGAEGCQDLVLDAHVLGAGALREQEGQDDLQLMRVMERRFLVWTPSDVPEAGGGVPGAGSASGKPDGEAGEAAAVPAAAPAAGGEPTQACGGGRSLSSMPRARKPQHREATSLLTRQGPATTGAKATAAAGEQPGAAVAAGEVAEQLQGQVEVAAPAAASVISLQQQEQEQHAAEGEEDIWGAAPVAACGGGAWDQGLAGIWEEFIRRLQGMRYSNVNLHSTDLPVSCALNDTEWRDGQLKRCSVKQSADVLKQIQSCQQGKRTGRLYVTDGSMPDYHQQQDYPPDAPGMPCGVDSRANAMLPHAVRSSRATNLFHAMKNESTGTKTFTLFGPAGGGTNLTAFHFETKRRRSYNCGTGDLIIQPHATLEAMRKLMRVHAAVVGRHTRHGQLLPPEVYLEEGVPLVMHVRDYPHATLCELCEQSMHAFVSFNSVASSPPALKVSCNDFDLVWELDSCYFMEKVATLYSHLRLFPEEALPSDGADTWVMSSYLLRKPHTLTEKQAGWERPWLCEAQQGDGEESHEGAAGNGELEDGDMHWGMDIIAVRCAEKMLDVLAGELQQTASWAGEVPDEALARQALRRARPVLLDMQRRAVSEADGTKRGSSGEFQPEWPVECHFSHEYMADLLEGVDTALQLPAADGGLAAGLPPAAKRQGQQLVTAGSMQDGGAAGSSTRDGLQACLLTAEAHAAYAGSTSDEERARLVQQADAMLAGAACLPALSELEAGVQRSHWLLRVQLEWEAGVAQDLLLLAKRRQQRSEAEALLDKACKRLTSRHWMDWKVQA